MTAGGSAHAGVEPNRGLLLYGVPARFGVGAVELAAERRRKWAASSFLYRCGVPGDDLADAAATPDRVMISAIAAIQRRFVAGQVSA